jgi:hypothetical protein
VTNQKAFVFNDGTSTNNGTYFFNGSSWFQSLTPRLLGEVYVAQSSQTLLGTSMTTVTSATVTATTTGGLIRATVTGGFNNAGSGANRSAQAQILCDGVLVGEVLPGSGQAFVGFISGNNTTPFTLKARHTPSAGSHTWTVQGLASAASAVYMSQVTLTVEELA